MDDWIKLIEVVSKLIGSFAWPLAVALIAWLLLRRHRGAIDSMLARMDSLTLPGGAEMTMKQQIEQQKEQIIEAAEEVTDAPPEQREPALSQLVEATNRSREVNRLLLLMNDSGRPVEERQQAMDELRERHDIRFGRGGQLRKIEDLDPFAEMQARFRRTPRS